MSAQPPLFDERQGPRVAPVHAPDSVVMYRVGGRLYPRYMEPRCKTCNSPYRGEIETRMLRGYGWTAIVRGLPEDANLNEKNLRTHRDGGHLPVDVAVRNAALDEEARARGIAIEEYAGSVVDEIVLARVAVQRVYEGIVDGRIRLDAKDGAAFAQILARSREEQGDIDHEMLTEAFAVYMETARAVMEEEQFVAFGKQLAANPVLRALAARAQGTTDVVDATPVEASA